MKNKTWNKRKCHSSEIQILRLNITQVEVKKYCMIKTTLRSTATSNVYSRTCTWVNRECYMRLFFHQWSKYVLACEKE